MEKKSKKSRRKKSKKIQAKKKLGQKLLQTLSKNRFKIQNNNPKNGASAGGASVVVLNFVSVFCKGLQELLAQLFFGLDFLLTFSFDFFSTFFSIEKVVKTVQKSHQNHEIFKKRHHNRQKVIGTIKKTSKSHQNH